MSIVEDAAAKMNLLVESEVIRKLQGANEAKTRLLIIDEVLSILGWSKDEYEPEQVTTIKSYTDYRLTIDGQPRLIVEAKRVGAVNPLPKNIQSRQYANSFLFNNYGPEMKMLLDQCINYCIHCGIPYALATTGEIWIVMPCFKLGEEWGKLKSLVFHSLKDIRNKFGEFYGLLSREAIKNNSLEEHFGKMMLIEPTVAIHPRDFIDSIPETKQIQQKQIIRAFFNNFMADITQPGQSKMLQQCYVDSYELNEFSRELQQILQYDAVIEESDLSMEEVDQTTLENELEIQSDSGNPKTILLVGNVGAGKSTFVHRFVKFDRPKQHICTIVNLINDAIANISQGREEEQRLADKVLTSLAQQFQDKLDPYAPAVLRGCFADRLGRFKKQKQILFQKDPDKYSLEEEDYLYGLSNDKYDHLVGYIRFARKKRYKVWVAFDNVDRGSDSYQQFIYSFAHQLCNDAKCVTLITLRQDTFLEAQEAGFLDVRSTDIVFQLKSPEFRQIISKRRKYIDRITNSGELPKLFKPYFQLINLLNLHIKHLLLQEDDFIRLFITAFSLNNIRYGLAMLANYYTSSHATFHEFYDKCKEVTPLNLDFKFNYELENNRFLQALMLTDGWWFEEKKSDVFNIFSVDRFEKVSHFLMLRILAYLSLKVNYTSSRYSVKYEKIKSDLVFLGYQSHHVNNATLKLLYAGLLISPSLPATSITEMRSEIPDPLPADTKIALSAKGYYYLQKLVSNRYYQTRVGEDMIWYNEEFAKRYIECLRDTFDAQTSGYDDTLQATDARETFIDYLKWSWLEEVQANNIRQTNKDWAQVINSLVERKVFGENFSNLSFIQANKRKSLENSEELLDEFYSNYSDLQTYDKSWTIQNTSKESPFQMPLFEDETIDYEQVILDAVQSLGSLPKGLKTKKISYVIRILWALEIAFRVGLGPLQAKEIANLIRTYGKEYISIRSVVSFFQDQKKYEGEYQEFWREEPIGFYTINASGQKILISQLESEPLN
ncbi:hypothetical protein [Ktedonobacter robiniae]|uniref:AAA+ ATPase domain-containing protein n=1 Tax=Ktedonobacter robiniae TaxID=2778365 RepID=A0ABQ3UKJ6_9CHLR|nr:hypothetical protein [Ktedonobacter robiniae]GHO53261.1 hypothetical protein KSB_17360 [Ktedonobacter robiniae]